MIYHNVSPDEKTRRESAVREKKTRNRTHLWLHVYKIEHSVAHTSQY